MNLTRNIPYRPEILSYDTFHSVLKRYFKDLGDSSLRKMANTTLTTLW